MAILTKRLLALLANQPSADDVFDNVVVNFNDTVLPKLQVDPFGDFVYFFSNNMTPCYLGIGFLKLLCLIESDPLFTIRHHQRRVERRTG